jgi:molybdate transport system permease protein
VINQADIPAPALSTGSQPRSLPQKVGNLWRILSLPYLVFLIVPLAALILRVSPARIAANLAEPVTRQAIALSLSTTLLSTGISILLGIPVAYWLSQRKFFLKKVVDTLVDMPTVLPPAVAGVALLMAFGRRGVFGGIFEATGIQIAFTTAAVIFAQVFVSAPYFIRAANLGFSAIDPETRQAAALDGANDWQVFSMIIVPLSAASLLTGVVMCWARALGEFGATIIFAGNFPGRTQTMPLAIYLGFELDLNIALTLSVILMSLSFAALLVVKLALHRDWA